MLKRWILILFLLLAVNIFAEKSDLDKIKAEISELKEKFSRENAKEKDEFQKLNNLEGSISTSQQLQDKIEASKRALEHEIISNSNSIEQLKADIENTILKQNENQEIIREIEKNLAARYRVLYKKRHQRTIFTLFDFSSFNQLIVKKKYFHIIKEQDQRNIEYYRKLKAETAQLAARLQDKRASLEKRVSTLNLTVEEKAHLLEAEQKALTDLSAKRNQKEQLLKEIAKNKKLYLTQISEKEKAAREMEELMRRLEAERRQREEKRLADLAALKKAEARKNSKAKKKNSSKTPVKETVAPEYISSSFPDLKKHLNWPVAGRIVGRFGSITNQETKTITFNTGVEIQSGSNMRVQAVSSGEVIKIFWLRGYGNTLILEHGDGFYTVYSNLEKIYKTEGQKISAGEPIAVVDSNNGRLHFEVWHKKEKLDPEEWLKD